MAKIAEIGKQDIEGNCLVCRERIKKTRILHIRRNTGDSIVSFNICRDCLRSLGTSINDAVDCFEKIN